MSEQSSSLIKLSSWGAIKMSGADSRTYLNSQVTAHISNLTAQQACFAAHCDAKGKSWSHFYFVPTGDDCQLFQRQSTIEKSLAELNKYGVFSRTDITHNTQLHWYAQLGNNQLEINQVSQDDTTYRVALSSNITLIATETQLDANNNEALFEKALIDNGIIFLHAEQQGEYVPQMLNLQAIDGISFNKGCYMGQETVARMRYLGKNKRAAFPFSGHADNINVGDTLEMPAGENWRRAGTVVSACAIDGQMYGMAVCAADLDLNTQLKLKNQDTSQFTLSELPYTLEYKASE
ncbi:folate-binding Fe/S cluster repair protein [Saccharobesus litoralis]|uniref:Folate-binding Fe/S cluster repair protein n=1 Tax=Saccharobesus litoralis TaxID=2172099 RepID=A0A2S0VS70_9ALTE|nr:folate-binding Fe/S cluster repair protein [Saccharobesus litoralis]AWB67054.1 folate-binding Fe/S cluster repair protein [Saccharobesus litoralis]